MNIKKIHIISNISTGKKIGTVFLLFLISSLIFMACMIKEISDAEKAYKTENEITILNSTEQYINASIENIVSITKTIYTNTSLYSLLNTEFKTPSEYYDAFYKLQESNSMSIAENQNIKQYTIYTENPTIISGGNIINLSEVQDEAWYKRFTELNKPLIFYCDNEEHTISLIRKLDYNTIDTGKCYLKIVLNNVIVENYFENLDFRGNLYVMSNGVLMFGNTDEKSIEDINITPDYQCVVKNYYTAELEYYAFQQKRSLREIVFADMTYIILFIVLFLISVITALLFIINIASRTKKFTDVLRSESKLAEVESSFAGNDEIGRMFSNCIMFFDKLQFRQREYNKCNDLLNKSYENSRQLLLQALHLDTKIRCFEKYMIENPDVDFSVPVSVKTEFDMLEKHMQNGKIKNYEIKLEPMSDEVSVLPFSVIMTADDLIQSPDEKISISAEANSECLKISFQTDTSVLPGKILKLRALFEDYPHQTDFDFTVGYDYNHYRRIKSYYGTDVSINISSENGFCLTMIFVI